MKSFLILQLVLMIFSVQVEARDYGEDLSDDIQSAMQSHDYSHLEMHLNNPLMSAEKILLIHGLIDAKAQAKARAESESETLAYRDMIRYFLNKGFGRDSVDSEGWNVAMRAAERGDLESLEDLLESFGAEQAAEIFNFQVPEGFKPTVFHAAILGGVKGSAEQAIKIIDFLVAHGADPSRRGAYRNLMEELLYFKEVQRLPTVGETEEGKRIAILHQYFVQNQFHLKTQFAQSESQQRTSGLGSCESFLGTMVNDKIRLESTYY